MTIFSGIRPMVMEGLTVGGGSAGGGAGANNGTGGGSGNTGDNGANASAGASGGANGNAGSAGGLDWSKWQEALPEDLRKDPSISSIKSLPDLAKSFVHAQKLVGADKIQVPDPKHATQSDYLNVIKKLGLPEKIEDYKFKMPDGLDEKSLNKEFTDSIKQAAHEVGVLPWQFEKIFGAYHGYAAKQVEASNKAFKEAQEKDLGALKQEWGKGYETEVKKADVAFKELVPNVEDRQRMAQDGLLAHPVVIKAFAQAAKLLSEDKFLGQGDGKLVNMTPEDALKRAREIQGDNNHPYRNPSHPNHKAAKEEVQRLYQQAFPS